MSKIIAVAVPKGGVGKTTTVVNLAASFAIAEKKTLIIDLDPSGACSISLGFNHTNIRGDIFNVFSFTKSFESVIHKTKLEFLDFVPSNIQSYQAEQRLERLTSNDLLIKNILRSESNRYDFIFIDCPPYLKGLTTNALAAADSVLIPVKAENFSIAALNKMINHLQFIKRTFNPTLTIEGIFLTMFETNTNVSTMAVKILEEHYNQYLLKTVIPKNVAITEATFQGLPAVLYKAISKGSQAYLNLATEILKNNNSL
jgi:chromosome partitioning protein